MGLEVIQTIDRVGRGRAAAATILVLASCSDFASGQQAAPAPSAAPPTVVPGTEQAKRTTPPLLREGSFIARARGRFIEDKARREWTFTPEAIDRSGLARTLVLLPNEVLGDAVRVARLAPEELEFELTGEVFLYRGRNFVLPSLLTPLAPSAREPAATDEPQAPSPAAPALPQDEEAIARELERRLAERLDRMPKAPAPQPTENAGERSAGGAAGQRSDERSEARGGLRSDTPIQSRRGQLVRDNATGGWRFVFEGQLAEGGEPSMPVLPCLALERIENSVRQSDGTLSLTVTGTTTLFEGRSYLLPSVFRVARGGRGIGP